MENIKIRNFKCFIDVEIPLNRLTVFAGANGNGKSTAIQALLFLRRTIEHCGEWNKATNYYEFLKKSDLKVELNGAYCLSLGSSSSLVPLSSRDNTLKIGIKNNQSDFSIEYDGLGDDNLWLLPIAIHNNNNSNFSIFKQEIHYLNAERIGPRIKQEIKFYDYPNTGYKGEFVAQLLGDTEFTYRFKVEETRRRIGFESPNLVNQVNAWLDFIMPDVSIEPFYDINTMSAQIRIENDIIKGNPVVAPNIGFGISYVLPIIVSSLIASKDTYLIVENPEAHLHPSAQSKIGQFLALIANSGVKVIIETHSDHVINGLQISSALNEIDSSYITINHFNYVHGDVQPNIESINISEKGELSKWPDNFFDQSQKDLRELFKIRKK